MERDDIALEKLTFKFLRGVEADAGDLEWPAGAEVVRKALSESLNAKNVAFLLGAGCSSYNVDILGNEDWREVGIPTMAPLAAEFTKKRAADEAGFPTAAERKGLIDEFGIDIGGKEYARNLEKLMELLFSLRFSLSRSTLSKAKESLKVVNSIIQKVQAFLWGKCTNGAFANGDSTVGALYETFYKKLVLRDRSLPRPWIFTTNYDLFNETAMDRLGLPYSNGFSGVVERRFNPATFRYALSEQLDLTNRKWSAVDGFVYLCKIHGSISWTEDDHGLFPIRETAVSKGQEPGKVMIYPTPAKQNSSLGSPYADLFREFQSRIVREQSVLFTMGYAFGDEHINNIIYQALTIPTFRLVIFGDPTLDGEIAKLRTLNDPRIWIIGGSGPEPDRKAHYFDTIIEEFMPQRPSERIDDAIRKVLDAMSVRRAEFCVRRWRERMSRDDRKRAIGKVVSVAADRFVVEMHAGTDNFTVVGFDDVHYVARLGSFLMVPVQTEYVVVEVVGLRERDIASAGRGEGELDKAGSAKYLDVVPVGMLPQDRNEKFRFGVSVFPSLYADALYALDAELDRVFDTDKPREPALGPDGAQPLPAGSTRYRALSIGRSVVFDGYDVKVRIDDFFGGHTAVLGNTGSGKSCTVASVLQSLFDKADEFHARGATFVVFDVNGEYANALMPLARESGIDVAHVVLDGTASEGKFRLPHWFLEQSEWELLLQASERTQLPVLRTALGLTGLFRENAPEAQAVKEHFIATCVIECFRGADGDSPVAKFQRVVSLLQKYPTKDLNTSLLQKYGANYQYGNFAGGSLAPFLDEVRAKLREDVDLPSYDRTPFTFDDLEECLDFAILYEEAHGNRQIRDYCSQMLTRFKSLRDRSEYNFMRYDIKPGEAIPTKGAFLEQLLGLSTNGNHWRKRHQIIIVDMNAVEDEVVELVSSVLARMIFRLLRQAEPRNRFPVHLLLEEAHRYISESPTKYAIDASKIYERIAKEGRKYGLFLLVASQRPSELSKTVLSQCSNFVIHRIQNPDDLSQIRQMTPFISEAVLKRLPSLPKQHALVFGTSVNLPTTFRVREAKPLPKSDDAKIGELWFHEEGRAASIRVTS